MPNQIAEGAAHPCLRVGSAKDQSGDPSENDRAGAHGAGLEGHIKRAVKQPPVTARLRRATDRDRFRMSGGVPKRLREIVAGREKRLATNDYRANRNLAQLSGRRGFYERAAHPSFVLLI